MFVGTVVERGQQGSGFGKKLAKNVQEQEK
jgi:hypothetical protein